MNKNFTPNSLIKLIYNEASEEERKEAEMLLENNWALKEEMALLEDSKSKLPKILFSPKQTTIDKILKFSQTTALETHF